MPSLYAIILAGGASSRFWPVSGDEHPKYLIRPDGERSLLALAWARAALCTDAAHILVVTAAPQERFVREALPDLRANMLCIEPARRDTAAAIALGCKRVFALDRDADVLVLPADTLLEPAQALAQGVAVACAQKGYREAIHVFGVNPARAEGGFGYIEPGEALSGGVIRVRGFREKPGPAQAAEFAKQGYLWNIGCFLFSLATFDRELRQHLPMLSTRLRPVSAGEPTARDYQVLDSISIDFGLIEKLDNLRAVRLDATFDDIGTWDALLVRIGRAGKSLQQALAMPADASITLGDSGDLVTVQSGGNALILRKPHGA